MGLPVSPDLLLKCISAQRIKRDAALLRSLVDYYVKRSGKQAMALYLLSKYRAAELLLPLLRKDPVRVMKELARLPEGAGLPRAQFGHGSKGPHMGAEEMAELKEQVLSYLNSLPEPFQSIGVGRRQLMKAISFRSVHYCARAMRELCAANLVEQHGSYANAVYRVVVPGRENGARRKHSDLKAAHQEIQHRLRLKNEQVAQFKEQVVAFLEGAPGSGRQEIRAAVPIPTYHHFRRVIDELRREGRVLQEGAKALATYRVNKDARRPKKRKAA